MLKKELDLALLVKGKVRDVFDLNDKLLIVVSDRISAFDVVFPNLIPKKGKILNKISEFWFNYTSDIIENHMITTDISLMPKEIQVQSNYLSGRSMLVKKAQMLKVECVVRGYLTGSALKEYNKSKSICGIALPDGLKESQRLNEPIFTPTTKALTGHDEPITLDQMKGAIGVELTREIVDKSVALYLKASKYAESKKIILADTKFEFGLIEGRLVLADELFTPDSSRFWDMDDYEVGRPQKSFDKQYLRDFLESIDWDKNPPAPVLPDQVINQTQRKYIEAYQRITGEKLT